MTRDFCNNNIKEENAVSFQSFSISIVIITVLDSNIFTWSLYCLKIYALKREKSISNLD